MNFLTFLLVGCFWGGSFVAIKYALGVFPPVLAALLRVGIGIITLTVAYRISGHVFDVGRTRRPAVWIAGLLAQGIPFAFLFWAEKTVSPGLAGIMNGTVPLWTYLLGRVFLPGLEPTSPRLLGSLGLGFAGLLIVYGPILARDTQVNDWYGVAALLVMATSYASATLYNRTLLSGDRKVDLYGSVFQQHLASFLFLLVVFWLSGESMPPWSAWSGSATGALVYLGVFSTGIAWMLFYRLIREWTAIRASAIAYVIPPVALVLDFLCFHRAAAWHEILGALAILASVFLMQVAKTAPDLKPARP